MIKHIQGLHLTALDKRAIAAIIKAGATQGKTPRKAYQVQPLEACRYAVAIVEQGMTWRHIVELRT